MSQQVSELLEFGQQPCVGLGSHYMSHSAQGGCLGWGAGGGGVGVGSHRGWEREAQGGGVGFMLVLV